MSYGIKLSKKQNEYIRNANRRINLKIGAVRSGKSYVDIAYVILDRLRSVKGKDGLNLILGVSGSTIERNVLQPMREIYTDGIVGTIKSTSGTVTIFGEKVYCISAEKINQVGKIQGMSVKYLYGDEIAKWNKEVFMMALSRMDKPYSKMDGACNPEAPTHWLKEFIDRKDLDSYIQKYTIFDNPYLPEEFVQNLCKEYEGTVYYGRLIEGNWTLAEGLIFPMYQDALCDPPEGIPDEECISVDYGTLNPMAGLFWKRYGKTWYAVSEYYYSGRDTGIQKTDEEYLRDIIRFYNENHDILCRERDCQIIVDPSAASFITALRRDGTLSVIAGKNDVITGIRETATALKQGYIKISRKLRHWIQEAGGYIWDPKAREDTPVKDSDHLMDSTRYFVKTKRIVAIATEPEYRSIFM